MKRSKRPQPLESFVAAIIPTEFHIVTCDSKPCTLINVSGLHKGGVLTPGSPVIAFSKVRDAERAIARTEKAHAILSGSLVREWLLQRIPPFTKGSKFEIIGGGHQAEPKLQLAAPKEAAKP